MLAVILHLLAWPMRLAIGAYFNWRFGDYP